MYRRSEFTRNRGQISQPKVHESARLSITRMLRKKQAQVATDDTHESWKSGLKAVLPLLNKTQTAVPYRRANRIPNAKNWNNLLTHPDIVFHTDSMGLYRRYN